MWRLAELDSITCEWLQQTPSLDISILIAGRDDDDDDNKNNDNNNEYNNDDGIRKMSA